MYRHIGLIALMLVALFPGVIANEHDAGISQSNRFLSAEVQRTISSEMDTVQEELQTYQDENFQILDTRINTFIQDALWKMALVAAGVGFMSVGIAAALVIRSFKKNTAVYQTKEEEENGEYYDDVVDEYAQEAWRPQQNKPTVSSEYGQEGAAQMSQMNAWQHQPAYQGSWKPPGELPKEFSHSSQDYISQNEENMDETYKELLDELESVDEQR